MEILVCFLFLAIGLLTGSLLGWLLKSKEISQNKDAIDHRIECELMDKILFLNAFKEYKGWKLSQEDFLYLEEVDLIIDSLENNMLHPFLSHYDYSATVHNGKLKSKLKVEGRNKD